MKSQTYKDASTYFLMGLYMDYKYHKHDLSLIHFELQSRWNLPERKNEFDEYFSNWNLKPENFNLTVGDLLTDTEKDDFICKGCGNFDAAETCTCNQPPPEETSKKNTFDFFFK